MYKKKKTGIN